MLPRISPLDWQYVRASVCLLHFKHCPGARASSRARRSGVSFADVILDIRLLLPTEICMGAYLL